MNRTRFLGIVAGAAALFGVTSQASAAHVVIGLPIVIAPPGYYAGYCPSRAYPPGVAFYAGEPRYWGPRHHGWWAHRHWH